MHMKVPCHESIIAREPDSWVVLAVGCSHGEFRLLQWALAASRFVVQHAATCRDAMAQIRFHQVAVVLSEAELPDGSWRDLIAGIDAVTALPPLIVVSTFADGCLWAEVLNLGGYDLLLKPLDCTEARCVVEAAARPAANRGSLPASAQI